eukprot:TRINITY_DN16097_c0_g2_i1.p1 TRINITY_DN16097_c0_g2~~TRINITY_DN16097_c0_g2_i1.p1  ORF type:complete len:442 (-),score=34.94 TRINITY_DN16097_c0_g2_i1:98-1423(-)
MCQPKPVRVARCCRPSGSIVAASGANSVWFLLAGWRERQLRPAFIILAVLRLLWSQSVLRRSKRLLQFLLWGFLRKWLPTAHAARWAAAGWGATTIGTCVPYCKVHAVVVEALLRRRLPLLFVSGMLVPLVFKRGRTLSRVYSICDRAQGAPMSGSDRTVFPAPEGSSISMVLADAKVTPQTLSIGDRRATEVFEWLLLGGEAAARNCKALRERGVGFVLNCCAGIPFASGETCNLLLRLRDSRTEMLAPHLSTAFAFLDRARTSGQRCLIHCRRGESRAVAVVLAYLVVRDRKSLAEAWSHVQAVRPCAAPNSGFSRQLIDLERIVQGRNSVVLADFAQRRNKSAAAPCRRIRQLGVVDERESCCDSVPAGVGREALRKSKECGSVRGRGSPRKEFRSTDRVGRSRSAERRRRAFAAAVSGKPSSPRIHGGRGRQALCGA